MAGRRTWPPLLLTIAASALLPLQVLAHSDSASGESPAAITLQLKDSSPAEVAAALSRALGLPVTAAPVERSLTRITLQLTDAGPREALDRAASALHGRWQCVYVVRPATAPDAPARRSFATGRRVTLNLEGAEPRVALSTVARADGGDLAATPPDGPRVTLKLDDVPVEEAMDQVTAALGLTWTREIQLLPGSLPGGVAPSIGAQPTAPTGSAPPGGPPAPSQAPKLYSLANPVNPRELSPGRTPSGGRPDLARALSDGMARLMQLDPAHRRTAVRQFSEQVERGLRELDSLSTGEKSSQRTQITRVYQSGMRVYRGLTPDQQQEFRPLFDVLRKWLGM